jgi:sugar (pentulose or hexulose) kinase
VVGVDVGSQGTCAQALEPDGTLVATTYAPHALSYPRAG